MVSRWLLTVALTLAPLAARADEAGLLAEYWADSGSLPPEYAWQTNVSISTDGALTLVYCTGYETAGPACKTRKAKVDEAHRAAILAAVTAGDFFGKPVRQAENHPVGGGAAGGKVYVEGQPVVLPAFPTEADAPRVAKVLEAIVAAIPERFRNRYFERN